MLPVTVQDQIRLWELERNRLKSREGKYSSFTRRREIHLHRDRRLPLQRLRITSGLRVRVELRQGA